MMNKSTKERVRSNFSHSENDIIYLNHAAISPLSNDVRSAMEHFLDERNRRSIDNFYIWMETAERTRTMIANLIGSSSEERITFMGNTSDGLSAVAEGLDWSNGDEILLNTAEFPSNVQPFRILEKQGVRVRYIDTDKAGKVTPERVEESITQKTRLFSISAVQYLSGFKADLESIGKICRENDIIFCVDGIQALGAVDVNVEKCNIDALASGCHKWQMAPMGTGYLYVSESLADRLKPSKTGWLSVEEPWELSNFNQEWLPVSSHLETGTMNMIGITGLHASLEYMRDIGLDTIYNEIGGLSDYLIDRIKMNDKVHLLTPDDARHKAGIVTFSLSNGDPEEIIDKMGKRSITISVRQGFIRISPHFYNTFEELDLMLEILTREI
ncbi:MAG: aminotransferase class V-fold PLP-dependent enzyme [Bacteroidetes bacterium]|jgi:selenocysteine lyase/cysteine desulfurase|nr:aminotransferase class V-fold PLP-dependent enzyme [Bacteroidota bacterium]